MKESEFLYKGHRNSYTEINEVYFRIQCSVDTDHGEFDVFVAYQPRKQGLLNIKSNKINF